MEQEASHCGMSGGSHANERRSNLSMHEPALWLPNQSNYRIRRSTVKPQMLLRGGNEETVQQTHCAND
jgi:hypothetical protein